MVSPLNCKGSLSKKTGTGLLPYIRPLYERFDLSGLDEISAHRPYRDTGFKSLRHFQVFDTPV
jgi:hypothetical protein